MTRIIGVYVCLVIVAMDIAAGILGIEAGIARNKACTLKNCSTVKQRYAECNEVSQKIFKMGFAAAALLGTAHIAANLLSGCVMCICSKGDTERSAASRHLWLSCFVSSWIVAAIGFLILLISMLDISKFSGSCRILHHQCLSTGGVLCFLHGILCMVSYATGTMNYQPLVH